MPITVSPGGRFGATLTFMHRGPAMSVWVGIGIAYAQITGHNIPRAYAMAQVTLGQDMEWFQYSVPVSGIVPTDTTTGNQDAQRFISNTQPTVGAQPPNPYGMNNWDDDVYAVLGTHEFGTITVIYS